MATYDYGANGAYFVTICTKDKAPYFGDIALINGEPVIQPTIIGQRTIDGWLSIPTFSPFVKLDAFQLMPNHLHGVLFINKPEYDNWEPNTFGPQSQNLASILRGFKSGVKAHATTNNILFCWQTKYYDRVIRNDNELNRIRHYIENNPAQWLQDLENPEGLYM
ncbi:transposase [Spirosoma fluviale]|uniref:transposase n=1 Tax=Spirosoma fluviale TaxID=1597977 RepID=UPI0015C9C17B|nr:transposase [Spirosoma fluviale]